MTLPTPLTILLSSWSACGVAWLRRASRPLLAAAARTAALNGGRAAATCRQKSGGNSRGDEDEANGAAAAECIIASVSLGGSTAASRDASTIDEAAAGEGVERSVGVEKAAETSSHALSSPCLLLLLPLLFMLHCCVWVGWVCCCAAEEEEEASGTAEARWMLQTGERAHAG